MKTPKLSLEALFLEHKWPVFAIGFITPREFVIALWLVTIRIRVTGGA